jgi:TolA-binding protein
MKSTLVFFMLMTFLLSACQTTEDIKRDQKIDGLSQQLVQAQKLNADTILRMQEMEERFSQVSGMIEESKHEGQQEEEGKLKEIRESIQFLEENINANNKLLQKTLKDLEEQKKFIEQLTQTLKKLSAQKSSPKKSTPKTAKASSKKPSYQSAIALYRAGKYKTAKSQLKTLFQGKKVKGKKLAHTLHNLGMISFMHKEYDSALTYFSKLYTDFPKSGYTSNGLLYLGKSFQAQKNLDDAKASFEELIKAFPKSKHAKMAQDLLKKL